MGQSKAKQVKLNKDQVRLLNIAGHMGTYVPTAKKWFLQSRKLVEKGLFQDSERCPGAFEITDAGLDLFETLT